MQYNLKNKKIAVLMGGNSGEREISLLSGNGVLTALKNQGFNAEKFDPAEQNLNQLKNFDIAFIALHGRHGEDGCDHCARDDKEKFYSDGCYSVHAEMRALFDMLKQGKCTLHDMSRATVYVTHGPCDACCKMLNFAGCKHVIYDEDYKTDYTGHWPELKVEKLAR